MAETNPFRVILWCVPRSASSVLTKCFSFIENTQVWFEPYTIAFFQDFQAKQRTGSYLPRSIDDFDVEEFMRQKRLHAKGTSLEHIFDLPSVDETLIIRDGVRRQLNKIPNDQSVFVKEMAYGITNFLDMLPSKDSGYQHTFLIRHPEKVFPAWRRLILSQNSSDEMTPGQAPKCQSNKNHSSPGQVAKCQPAPDLSTHKEPPHCDEMNFDMTTDVPYMMPGYSYKCQYDLWMYIKENFDPNPIVIDADDILSDPLTMLSKFTNATRMNFEGQKSLYWDASADVVAKWRCFIPIASAKPGDFIYRTHSKAIFSSSFRRSVKFENKDSTLSPDVIKCINQTRQYYKEMAKHKLI